MRIRVRSSQADCIRPTASDRSRGCGSGENIRKADEVEKNVTRC